MDAHTLTQEGKERLENMFLELIKCCNNLLFALRRDSKPSKIDLGVVERDIFKEKSSKGYCVKNEGERSSAYSLQTPGKTVLKILSDAV